MFSQQPTSSLYPTMSHAFDTINVLLGFLPLLGVLYGVSASLPCVLLAGAAAALSDATHLAEESEMLGAADFAPRLQACVMSPGWRSTRGPLMDIACRLTLRLAKLRIASNQAPGYVAQALLAARGTSWKVYCLKKDIQDLVRDLQNALDICYLRSAQYHVRPVPEAVVPVQVLAAPCGETPGASHGTRDVGDSV
ncbi:hypothetical protein BC834DRAFT_240564 [Gloeopeniophorella convolvens]|nr:hypothetical protein BC834DRAFT_240564 [Gloeopeniophorella convolvens]